MKNHYLLTNKTDNNINIPKPNWFRPNIDPALIRSLMAKSDAIALKDTILWLGAMIVFCYLGIVFWGSWWSVPFWLVYGVLYGSAADSRWHECGHNTAFKSEWCNNAVYQIASFMMMRSPNVWRASHVRHHTDTIIVGRDPEIHAMRPPDLLRVSLNFFGILDTYHSLARMLLHASGRIDPQEATYLREKEYKEVFFTARIWLLIYALTLFASIWFASILPLMIVGLPRLYGAWHGVMVGLLQHLGLAENVTDHRLNTRTVLMNPISRFIYLNMNYHLEHHMFTMVPYYNLPKLHNLIKTDLPEPETSIFSAWRKLLPVLVKQLQYKDVVIIPTLPVGAEPFRDEVERLRPFAV